jgi:hypothetical protein
MSRRLREARADAGAQFGARTVMSKLVGRD